MDPPPRPQYEQMPLVDDDQLMDVMHLVMSTHSIERCEERGIGILEVYSAVADPQYTRTRDDSTVQYLRGDLSVAVDPKRRSIVTVIDRQEDYRTTPRVPLNPLINRGANRMASRNGSAGLEETWCLLAHTEPDMRLVTITPALAEKLLSLNTHNRPLNKTLVNQYKADIEAGSWRITHQGVALDTTPALQDGQHRLTAIFETGVAQPMMVAVGMDPGNFAYIDIGRNRKYSDVLALEGYTDTYALGATARLVYLYQHKDFISTHKVSNAQVMELVESDENGFTNAMTMGRRLQKGMLMTRTAAGAGYYVVRKVNPATMVNDFFEALITGEDIPHGDPRPRLVRAIANSQRSKMRRPGPEQLALLIKTWNAWAEGRSPDILAWRKAEPMPRVTRVDKGSKRA